MPALPAPLTRAWRAVERFAAGRAAPFVLVAAALAVYGAVSVALPLEAGRDLGRYLIVWEQLLDRDVVYPHALASRTPGTPLVTGALLELGPVAAELGAALLYALSVLAWVAVARRFGPGAAAVTAVALLAYPGYVLLFHALSSDAVFAAAFAGFALLLARALERPAPGRAAALGAGVAGLVLVRPVSQLLLALVLLPLLAPVRWRARFAGAAAFAVAAVVPLAALTIHNGVRAEDYTVVRGGGASIPLFRAFVSDRIVEPDNGPASRELARAVERRLLPNEPYRSYRVDLGEFFSSGSFRMHEDLIGLSDRVWGWDDDYAHLARVGREAVLAHPGAYARGVARDTWRLLLWPLYARVQEPPAEAAVVGHGARATVVATREDLPEPSEGEPIPSAYQSAYISTPDGRIREVWTSPVDHRIVFRDASDRRRAAELDREVGDLLGNVPEREQRPGLVRALNHASRWYPRPFMWLLAGLAAVALRRPLRAAAPLVLAASAAAVLLGTSLTVFAVAEYAVPVVPAFVLLAVAGLLGPRRTPLRT